MTGVGENELARNDSAGTPGPAREIPPSIPTKPKPAKEIIRKWDVWKYETPGIKYNPRYLAFLIEQGGWFKGNYKHRRKGVCLNVFLWQKTDALFMAKKYGRNVYAYDKYGDMWCVPFNVVQTRQLVVFAYPYLCDVHKRVAEHITVMGEILHRRYWLSVFTRRG